MYGCMYSYTHSFAQVHQLAAITISEQRTKQKQNTKKKPPKMIKPIDAHVLLPFKAINL